MNYFFLFYPFHSKQQNLTSPLYKPTTLVILEIPEKFNNSLSDHKFANCSVCQADLSIPDTEYLIEKAYRRFPDNHGEELIFEVAVCFSCAAKMRGELSKESLKNIQSFFEQKGMEQRMANPHASPSDLLHKCLLSGKDLQQMQEYQIYAHCKSGELAAPNSYYMLSDDMIEAIQELLSDHTREQLEKFSDDNIGMPPELRKLFSQGDLLVI